MSKHLAEQTCILPHLQDPDRPRLAHHGLLCTGHYRSLELFLAELPALNNEADRSLTPIRDEWRSRAGSDIDNDLPPLSLRPTALPFDEDVSDRQRDLRDKLACWSANVVDQHPSRPHPPIPTVEALSTFLFRWLPWIVAQTWIVDMRGELRHAQGRLHAALTPLRSRRVDLGPCDAEIACDIDTQALVTCDGIMQAVVRTSDDNLPAEIGCTVCGLTKQPSEWRALSRRLRGNADPMLTAAQLSQIFRIPVGTLQRWAGEDDWRRTSTPTARGRITRYHHDDAQASYDKHPERHPEEAAS